MASVHRRAGSKYYQAAWRDLDGKAFQRSTKQTDHNKAFMVAVEWELFARGEHPTEAQARDVLNDILKRSGCSTIEVVTAEDHFKRWLEGKRLNKTEGTYNVYKTTVKRFLETLGDDKKLPLKNITERHVRHFVSERLGEGLRETTVAQNLRAIRSALKSACKNGQIPFNPADSVEDPRGETVERSTFSSVEIQMLLAECQGEWRTLIQLAYYTGARMGDCCKMVWSGTRKNRQQCEGVDLTGETLTYWAKKNSKLITLPLHRDLLALLEELAGSDQVDQYLMPKMAGRGSSGQYGLSTGFKRIVKRAGLDLEIVERKGKRTLSRRTFHSLRHSFNSGLANAGVDQKLRMALTGHKTEAINDIYTHHGLKTLRKAISHLPGLKGAKP